MQWAEIIPVENPIKDIRIINNARKLPVATLHTKRKKFTWQSFNYIFGQAGLVPGDSIYVSNN